MGEWKNHKGPEFDKENDSSASVKRVCLMSTNIMSLEKKIGWYNHGVHGIISCSNYVEIGHKWRKKELWLNKQKVEMQMSMLITLRSKMTKLWRINFPAPTNCEKIDLEYFPAAFGC